MDLAILAQNKPDVWSRDIEAVLDSIRINAYIMSEVHRKQFLQLKNFSNYFDIPVIVISAVNTIISVGVQSFLPQPTISITNCVLSATCGIIVSVKLYLAIQTQMELELSTSKDFYTLSTNIYKTISLNASNRGVDGIAFLNTCFQEYSELVQKSTMLRNKIDDKLVPHKISLLESLYRIPAHITGNEISHLDLKEISADINNLSLNPSKYIPKNIAKEEEEEVILKEEETPEDNV
jgi:hypothetical protein